MARFILGHAARSLGARSDRIERALYRLDRAFFATLLWLIRRLPVEPAARFGTWFGARFGPRFKKSRALDENLRVAFPDAAPEWIRSTAREAWANAGAVFAEYAHLETIAQPEKGHLECEVRADIETLRNPSRPAIFVAAHQANWEMAGAAIASFGVPLAAVYSPPTNPLLDEMLHHWRSKLGCELLPRDESMRPMIRALQRGRSLGLVLDRRVDSGRDVEFFGHPKPTSLVAARLALRFGFELVPLQIVRLGNARFRAIFHPPVAPPPNGAGELEQAGQMMRAMHAQFENWIRERPGQWFCSKRLWPKEVYTHAGADDAGERNARAA